MTENVMMPSIQGDWWDEVWKRDSQGVPYLERVTNVRKNTKMDVSAVLMAALMANDPGNAGILQHAQGRGTAGWGTTPPAVSTGDLTLFDEAGRLAPDSIVFLDAFDVPVAGPTNVILVKTTYDETELVGETLREQGLFGGTASATADSGIIINVIRHAPLFKSGAFSLIRNIKLTFS